MSKIARAAGLCLAAWLAGTSAAHAHIKLLSPASWIQENGTGDPQKSSPCGPAPGTGTETGQVTTYSPGQEITVEWTETVAHNGHFRIALARERSELVDPKVNGNCQSAEIQDPPAYPILADGLFPTTSDDGKRMFSTKVKLPADMTCDNCTLQLIQFMTPHGAPCFYYHCANLKIVAGGGSAGGGESAGGRGGQLGTPGGGEPAGGRGEPAGGRGGGPGAMAASGGDSSRSGPSGNAGNISSSGSSGSFTSAQAGTPSAPPSSTTNGDSGCSLSAHRGESNSTRAVLCTATLVLMLRRRRRRPG